MARLWDLEDDIRHAEDQLETAQDTLENAERAISSDKMSIRSKQAQLLQREQNLIKLKERVQYCKGDIRLRRRIFDQLTVQKSDLQITIELLQEDPGTEDKVKELKKELERINKLLTN